MPRHPRRAVRPLAGLAIAAGLALAACTTPGSTPGPSAMMEESPLPEASAMMGHSPSPSP